jgi:5,10-methylene-tetrahydrofolate dehydrogenase/methenyl tetrahydrofolate cyclohydrolase
MALIAARSVVGGFGSRTIPMILRNFLEMAKKSSKFGMTGRVGAIE